MSNDSLERRSYRKSPGRQYVYDYDPLRSQSESTASKPDALLIQRPNPRRTRQFLRQSIIASKRSTSRDSEPIIYHDQENTLLTIAPPLAPSKKTRRIRYTSQDLAAHADQDGEVLTSRSSNPPLAPSKKTRRIRYTSQDLTYDERNEIDTSKRFGTHTPSRTRRIAQPHQPATRDLARDTEEMNEEWNEFVSEDTDLDLSETERPRYEEYAERAERPTKYRRQRSIDLPAHDELVEDDYDLDRIYEEDEALPVGLHVVKHARPSRRGLLVGVGMGVGILAVGGVVAASNLASKAGPPSDHTSHAMQEAFNRGVAQGADSTRREFVSALDALEGFSLQGAIDAAKLTRVAYDVFVSPVVQFGSQLTTDFLKAMVNAFKTARGWLAGIYQDNTTLAAIQHVLESWVDQVSKLPKQLDAITQTDLDGAQAYLTALQRKIADEKSKLNTPHPTPTASLASKSTALPK